MIPNGPEISVFRVPLDVAGQTVIRQRVGYFHLWQFENISDGSVSLTGQVSATFGGQATQDDAVPLSYNSRMQFRPTVELVTLRWQAQANTRAVFVMSASADALEANNIPARQIVFQGQATSIVTGVAAVGTVAAQLVAANGFRQRLIAQAPVTNPATVVVGDAGVTLANGLQIEPGGSIVLQSSAPLFGLASAAGGFIRWLEERA